METALNKGNASSDDRFELIIHLGKVEMRCSVKLLITHVTGTRMIAQDTDGLSIGPLREGVAVGEAMLSYFPWENQP